MVRSRQWSGSGAFAVCIHNGPARGCHVLRPCADVDAQGRALAFTQDQRNSHALACVLARPRLQLTVERLSSGGEHRVVVLPAEQLDAVTDGGRGVRHSQPRAFPITASSPRVADSHLTFEGGMG